MPSTYTATITEFPYGGAGETAWTAEIFRDAKRVKTTDPMDKFEALLWVKQWVKDDHGTIGRGDITLKPCTRDEDVQQALALSIAKAGAA